VFQLKSQVRLNDGSGFGLDHVLELAYPPDADEAEVPEKAPTRADERTESRRSVFLSAGSADSALASELRTSLIDNGIDVWSDEDIPSGVPWDLEIERALQNADAVVAMSSEIPSKWVEREVGAATDHGTKVIPVVIGDNAVVPKGLESVQQIRLDSGDAVDEATDSILRAIEASSAQ
jgi:nucleotide-binding universal stress UspA family protein